MCPLKPPTISAISMQAAEFRVRQMRTRFLWASWKAPKLITQGAKMHQYTNLCCLHVCRKYHLLSRERVQPFIDAEEKVNKVPGVSQIHQAFSTKERWKNSGFKNQTNLKGKASCTRSGLLLQAVPGEGLAKLRAQGLFVNIFCQSVNWNLLPFLQEYVEEPKEIQFSFKEVVKFEKK